LAEDSKSSDTSGEQRSKTVHSKGEVLSQSHESVEGHRADLADIEQAGEKKQEPFEPDIARTRLLPYFQMLERRQNEALNEANGGAGGGQR
jgi:hypothetical protein